MPVTQKDIARALGVSVMAVQRALNNAGYVSRPLKERILAYASSVNYRPHRAAQALVRNKVRRLAFFSVEEPDFFWNDVATGIETAHGQIAPFGYEVRYQRVPHGDTGLYLRKVREALRKGVDGVGIVNNYEFEMERVFALLESAGVSYITFNIDAERTRRLCFIGPDYALEGRLAADFLGKILCGTGTVGVLFSDVHKDWAHHSREISSERLRGFLEYGGSAYPRIRHLVRCVDHTLPDRVIRRRILAFLASARKRIDALYCIPPYSALAGRCLQEAGLGGKVALVTFDLYPELKSLINAGVVTGSICQKPVQQGYYAVKMLELLLESKSAPSGQKFFISPHIVVKANVDVEDDLFTIGRIMAGDSRAWGCPPHPQVAGE